MRSSSGTLIVSDVTNITDRILDIKLESKDRKSNENIPSTIAKNNSISIESLGSSDESGKEVVYVNIKRNPMRRRMSNGSRKNSESQLAMQTCASAELPARSLPITINVPKSVSIDSLDSIKTEAPSNETKRKNSKGLSPISPRPARKYFSNTSSSSSIQESLDEIDEPIMTSPISSLEYANPKNKSGSRKTSIQDINKRWEEMINTPSNEISASPSLKTSRRISWAEIVEKKEIRTDDPVISTLAMIHQSLLNDSFDNQVDNKKEFQEPKPIHSNVFAYIPRRNSKDNSKNNQEAPKEEDNPPTMTRASGSFNRIKDFFRS
jgi:hypothetical protein